MIRKESRLADLIACSGLVGNGVVSQESQQGNPWSVQTEPQNRPCSAPASRSASFSPSRQLSRANSRAAVILGLQATSSRRATGSGAGTAISDAEQDLHGQSSPTSTRQRSAVSRNSSLRCNSGSKAQPLEAWQEPATEQQDLPAAAIQQLQLLHQELEKLTQQLAVSQTAQQSLELQLQQQELQHQQTVSDLQAQHDSSSKKLFRELKNAQAAKEQALAGKRAAEHANRDVQQELASVQAQQQQQQQQLALVGERLTAANKKLEQQARAHEEAKQRAATAASRQQEQLEQQLKAKEATIKETEESLRRELHKRTSTILNMQAELEEQGAALATAAEQSQQLQGRVQELQTQLSGLPSAVPSSAGQAAADIAADNEASWDGDQQHQQQQVVQVVDKGAYHPCNPVLERQLQLPESAVAAASSSSNTADAEAAIAAVAGEDLTMQAGPATRRMNSNRNKSRPVSASAQMLRHSLQCIQASGSSSDAVKVLGAQVDGLTAALAAAKREMADIRQEYAQNLEQLESNTAAAEASAAACWEAYDVTFDQLVKRVSHLLHSHCEGSALPFHRPRSAATASGVGTPKNAGFKAGPMFPVKARPASARPASAAAIDQVEEQQQPGAPGRPTTSSNTNRLQSASTVASRPQTANHQNGANAPIVTASGGSSSSVQAFCQMNQRLCDENAWLLVELSKWEAGHHQKQVALAAAAKQQQRFGSIQSSTSSSSRGVGHLSGRVGGNSSSMGRSTEVAAAAGDSSAVAEVVDHDGSISIAVDDAGSADQQQQESAHNSSSITADQASRIGNSSRSGPVGEAVKIAVKEALQARKGPVLPALLLQGLDAENTGNGSGSIGSSTGWAAAGSSRLVAALSAAEMNMKLRTRVLQLESAVAALRAEHAGDDSQSHQQQQRIRQLENMVAVLTSQLADAQAAAEDAREKMQQSLAVAAAAVAQHSSPSRSGQPQGFTVGQTSDQICGQTGSTTAAAVVPGIGVDEVLSCGGGGLLRDLPVAVQQEIAAQRRIAAAAKADKEARSRALTQLELRYSTLASRLVKARQAVANRDSQVAQLQQALAVAYNALLDAGIDLQQQQSVIWRAITAAAGQQQQSAAVGLPAAACGAAVGSSDSIVNDDVMSMVLSSDASDASVCSSRLGGGTSSVYSSAAGANAAAAASWTAAMESRERQWQIQRLTAECTDKQQKVDAMQQELRRLQQQLSKQQRTADAALAALAAEENSRRQSLAGDLEGATTAMQEATRKLAASQQQCADLQQQLAAALRRQQQLQLDVSYLRSRRAAGGGTGLAVEATVVAELQDDVDACDSPGQGAVAAAAQEMAAA